MFTTGVVLGVVRNIVLRSLDNYKIRGYLVYILVYLVSVTNQSETVPVFLVMTLLLCCMAVATLNPRPVLPQ